MHKQTTPHVCPTTHLRLLLPAAEQLRPQPLHQRLAHVPPLDQLGRTHLLAVKLGVGVITQPLKPGAHTARVATPACEVMLAYRAHTFAAV